MGWGAGGGNARKIAVAILSQIHNGTSVVQALQNCKSPIVWILLGREFRHLELGVGTSNLNLSTSATEPPP